jgi:hypothetical protein
LPCPTADDPNANIKGCNAALPGMVPEEKGFLSNAGVYGEMATSLSNTKQQDEARHLQ